MAVPPPPSKSELRAELRARRRAHRAALAAAGRLAAAEAAISAGLLAAVPPGATVALYRPHGDEAAFPELAAALRARDHALALPALDDAGQPRFAAWASTDPLVIGPFGMDQPSSDAADAWPGVIVAPLLGFDRRGGRLGQGGGHYDRLFARHPDARRIGCGWSVQEVAAVPLEEWDAMLDAVVTEADRLDCGGRR